MSQPERQQLEEARLCERHTCSLEYLPIKACETALWANAAIAAMPCVVDSHLSQAPATEEATGHVASGLEWGS